MAMASRQSAASTRTSASAWTRPATGPARTSTTWSGRCPTAFRPTSASGGPPPTRPDWPASTRTSGSWTGNGIDHRPQTVRPDRRPPVRAGVLRPGVSGDRTDYVTPGFCYVDEAFYDDTVTHEAPRQFEPSSRQSKVWVRQPQRTDWFDDPAPTTSGCSPGPVSRTRGNLHVELVDWPTSTNGSAAASGTPTGRRRSTRKLTLHRNGHLVGEAAAAPPTSPFRGRPVTTGSPTTWTPAACVRCPPGWTPPGRSAPPARPAPTGPGAAALGRLCPTAGRGQQADRRHRHLHRPAGARGDQQKITSFELWTSADDGATWRPVPTSPGGRDAFAAHLPKPGAGQAVSLRVKATAAAAAASTRPSSAPTGPDSPAASSRGRSVTESRCRTGPVHQHVSVPTMPHADVMAVGVRAVLPGRRPSMLSGVVESNAVMPAR